MHPLMGFPAKLRHLPMDIGTWVKRRDVHVSEDVRIHPEGRQVPDESPDGAGIQDARQIVGFRRIFQGNEEGGMVGDADLLAKIRVLLGTRDPGHHGLGNGPVDDLPGSEGMIPRAPQDIEGMPLADLSNE